jgi:hypothetical protein
MPETSSLVRIGRSPPFGEDSCCGVGDTPPTDVNWRRETKGELKSLPRERKVLAERYTIDADEADRRVRIAAEQAAAEESARQAAAQKVARRAAAAEAARKDASGAMKREAPIDPELAAEPSEPLVAVSPQEEPLEQTADLPIYRWFGNS